jgi:hypothetical protein
MAKNIRKVGLLKDTKPATKPAFQTDNATAKENPGTNTTRTGSHGPAQSSKALVFVGKMLSYLLLLLVMALILLPKPELLRYQKLHTVATSIYWPGLYGVGEGLVDSDLAVYIDRSRQELNLCYQHEQTQQCTRYQILQQGGLVDVLLFTLGF